MPAALRTPERPTYRWLAAFGASVAETGARQRPTYVRPLPGGAYLHRHTDGTLVLAEVLTRKTPPRLENQTRDIFCFGYTPKRNDIVIDIGAGDGEETVTFSRLVGPSGRVISVEAHPDTFRRLVLACRYNNLSNVTLLQFAVADSERMVSIDNGVDRIGGWIAANIGAGGTTKVPAVTVDSIVAAQECDRVDLLKMNIEGAEQLAIKGMSQSVERIRNVAISCHDFMVHPGSDASVRDWFATYHRVTEHLKAAGFKLRDQRSADSRPWVRYYVYGSRP